MDRIRVLSLFFTIFVVASRSLGSPHRKISSVDSAIDKVDNSSGSGGSPSISPSGSVQGSLNSNLNPPVVNEIHEKSPSPSPEDPAKSDANGKGSRGREGGSKDQSHVGDRAPEPGEKCNPSNSCTDHEKMIACLQGSEKLLLVVHNEGNDTLKVNIKLSSVEFLVEELSKQQSKEVELSKQQSKEFKLRYSVNAGDPVKVVLNAGHGDCIIRPAVSPGNFFHNLPSYTSLMTPIYGACVLFLTAVIAGGAWACCKFGRKRRHSDGGVPYQELEMGVPESTTQDTAADITNGWDRSWDDDWEDELTRVPDKSTGNAKVNGLSSKAAKGEGWDDDWDD